MKVKDVAKQYGIDYGAFANWIKTSGATYKSGAMGGMDIDESQDISGLVASFQAHQAVTKQQGLDAAAAQAHAAQQKSQALSSMLITSGFSFDGHTITKYSGYISGDDVTQIARDSVSWSAQTGKNSRVNDLLTPALVQIRRTALAELKEAAWALGCNAVIGVDFDYLTLEPETATLNGRTKYLPYIVCVTANGNAVVIEKQSLTGLS